MVDFVRHTCLKHIGVVMTSLPERFEDISSPLYAEQQYFFWGAPKGDGGGDWFFTKNLCALWWDVESLNFSNFPHVWTLWCGLESLIFFQSAPVCGLCGVVWRV